MKKIMLVAGARPNFMKIAPILREIEKHPVDLDGILVHTGQHYDKNMSDGFFHSLGIKDPKYNLGVGSGSHAQQTANIMIKFEEVCLEEKPDVVLVVGDVNSTIAAGLVAKKLNIKLCHVEAGLRSGDRTMPEEINRIATDAITDIFFTTEKEGTQNLLQEGHSPESVHFVGHVMIDNLFFQLARLKTRSADMVSPEIRTIRNRLTGAYFAMTMHRPSNVDNKETLTTLLDSVSKVAEKWPVVFPCHPRTKKNIERFSLDGLMSAVPVGDGPIASGIILMDPLGYDDFLFLWKDACCVLTDSGGLQEETTALKVPCITMRTSTERPITAEVGSNQVVGTNGKAVIDLSNKAILGEWKKCSIPDLWDGKASERIVEILIRSL